MHVRVLPAALFGSAAAIVCTPFVPASAADDGAVANIEEVIVTAQKRAERLIDVPLSISAVDAASMQARGANNLQDVQYSVPGLSALEYGPGNEHVQLRGISSVVGRPTVGKYLDEMPINIDQTVVGLDLRLIDMERVEVLRGPQPTLYGDGSMGGTIRYVTASPDLGQASASVNAEAMSVADGDNGWLVNGHVNVPLVQDRAALRVAVGYEDQGGWIDRPATGQQDINGYQIATARAKLLVQLNDKSDVSLLLLHQESDQDNQHFGSDRSTAWTVPTYLNTKYDLASVVFRYDLGFAELIETPGYLRYSVDTQLDLSPFYVPALALFGYPPGFITEVSFPGQYDTRIFTNQLRLVSKNDDAWSWAAGIDYRDFDIDVRNQAPTAPNPLPFTLLDYQQRDQTRTWGFWGEVGYEFTDRFNATVGLRYFHDRSERVVEQLSFGVPTGVDGTETFTSSNPRLNLSYKLSDRSLLYFNAAKGFRSGGFNGTSLTTPTYDPEQLWSYELGSKGAYFDGLLNLEASVYYNDWQDVQTNYFTPAGLTVTTNGGHIQGWGADLSAVINVSRDLRLGATYGWNNLEYKEVPANGDKAVGDPPDWAVNESWSAFVDYRRPVFEATAFTARIDFQHGGESRTTLRSPVFDQISITPARDLLNARIGLDFKSYGVALYVNNALDDDTPVLNGPFGTFVENIEQRPRVYGVSLHARF
ncbi:TonB-dependent receptor [Steroidobacter sp.]|uniref:TonB-dependent receptor n=1 Tax=Steroidobacter sp. TaxID=1978227 RepID=UPI001A513A4D|nr:TonB-dependent receptor [Steroidobacter sp.]MBL8269640.1 TonB-dependent receptor [Steroidobacter sp.]